MTDVADTCAELATLAPLLAPALRRDNTHTGRYGRLETTLSLFNSDVFYCKNRLTYEIPAAAIRAAAIVGETWPDRPIGTCLRALPRFHTRMDGLGMATEARQLDLLTRSWLRQTKRALGLRRPDMAVLDNDSNVVPCPACDITPRGELWMAGAEAFLNPYDLTEPPKWRHDPRVYCTQDSDHVWQEPEWARLALLVKAVRERQLA